MYCYNLKYSCILFFVPCFSDDSTSMIFNVHLTLKIMTAKAKKKLLLADFDKKHQLQCCDTYFIIISLCAISLSMLHVHLSYYTTGCDLILQVVCFTFFGLCKDVNYGTQLKKSHSISYLFCIPFFVLF